MPKNRLILIIADNLEHSALFHQFSASPEKEEQFTEITVGADPRVRLQTDNPVGMSQLQKSPPGNAKLQLGILMR
jgi:hypothetical protein